MGSEVYVVLCGRVAFGRLRDGGLEPDQSRAVWRRSPKWAIDMAVCGMYTCQIKNENGLFARVALNQSGQAVSQGPSSGPVVCSGTTPTSRVRGL